MAKKGYQGPTPGDVCYIRKGFGPWSSSTQVTVIEQHTNQLNSDGILCRHLPTKQNIEVDPDNLTLKRGGRGR